MLKIHNKENAKIAKVDAIREYDKLLGEHGKQDGFNYATSRNNKEDIQTIDSNGEQIKPTISGQISDVIELMEDDENIILQKQPKN